jgi:hypothetical protein
LAIVSPVKMGASAGGATKPIIGTAAMVAAYILSCAIPMATAADCRIACSRARTAVSKRDRGGEACPESTHVALDLEVSGQPGQVDPVEVD